MLEENLDENLDDGYVSPTSPTVEDYRELEKKNRKLFARAKKAEGELGKAKAAAPKEEPKPPQAQATTEGDDAWKERIELKTEGYSDEEIGFLQKNGGRAAKEDPFVKGAIESMRMQKKAEQAQVADTTSKSEIEQKFTEQQLREMPTAELEKILPKAQ